MSAKAAHSAFAASADTNADTKEVRNGLRG